LIIGGGAMGTGVAVDLALRDIPSLLAGRGGISPPGPRAGTRGSSTATPRCTIGSSVKPSWWQRPGSSTPPAPGRTASWKWRTCRSLWPRPAPPRRL